MRMIACAAILASGLLLAGCDTTTQIGNAASTVDKTANAVQSATVSICKFVPTTATVAKILSAGNSTVSTVAGIAQAICDAVTTRPLADGPGNRVPRVAGVVVKGQFVK